MARKCIKLFIFSGHLTNILGPKKTSFRALAGPGHGSTLLNWYWKNQTGWNSRRSPENSEQLTKKASAHLRIATRCFAHSYGNDASNFPFLSSHLTGPDCGEALPGTTATTQTGRRRSFQSSLFCSCACVVLRVCTLAACSETQVFDLITERPLQLCALCKYYKQLCLSTKDHLSPRIHLLANGWKYTAAL